ncbi:MAG: hypothetical protein L0Z53_13915, partial [Acidobacteriales bacterium]|nr:hypothetical protein [Terriglobales bacterium]
MRRCGVVTPNVRSHRRAPLLRAAAHSTSRCLSLTEKLISKWCTCSPDTLTNDTELMKQGFLSNY